MQQKTRDFHFDIKNVEKNGIIEGYGSVFDVKDSDDEIIARGAFLESLAWYQTKGLKPPMLWMHQAKEPLGAWEEAREDEYGLYMRGRMLVEDVQSAKEKHALAQSGALSGLSIGFRTLKSHRDTSKGAVVIDNLRLWEVSLVTFPANEEARITGVKSDGTLPTEREFEELLRDAGFSKSKALSIIAKGYKSVLHGDHAQEASLAELKRAIDNLKTAVSQQG